MTTPTNKITEITDYVNAYRQKHNSPDLVWNANIALYSQNWSDYLLSHNLFKHSNTTIYGENLAYYKGYGTDFMSLLKMSIDDWYNEISKYNFNIPGYSPGTGHFTTLVWKSCKSFGMGISINATDNIAIIVYNCSPVSNVDGQFIQNVLPPILNPAPTPTPTPDECTKSYIITTLQSIKTDVRIYDIGSAVDKINSLITKIQNCNTIQ